MGKVILVGRPITDELDLTEISAQVDTIESNLSDLSTDVDTLETKVTTLETTADLLTGDETVEGSVDNKIAALNVEATDVPMLDERLSRLEKMVIRDYCITLLEIDDQGTVLADNDEKALVVDWRHT